MTEEYGASLKGELLIVGLTGVHPSFAAMTLHILMAREILILEMTFLMPLTLITSIQRFRQSYQIG
uniref:Uncharacterized protein n=1 Tax=Rhizophora mucronata TaxID=61149 RepID=A0A2P2QU04_RHIMU